MKNYILILFVTFLMISCDVTENEGVSLLSVERKYEIPHDFVVQMKDGIEFKTSDTLKYKGTYVEFKISGIFKDSISFITHLKLNQFGEKKFVATLNIDEPINLGTAKNPAMMIEGSISFTETSITRVEMHSRSFEISGKGNLIKEGGPNAH